MELSEVRVWAAERREKLFLVLSVVLLVGMAGTVLVASAQQLEGTWQDDFEDGNVNGWSGNGITSSDRSYNGQYSLAAADDTGSISGFPAWDDGPLLDTGKEFVVNGTSRVDLGDGNWRRSGFGVINESDDGVLLLFSAQYGSTFLARTGDESFDEGFDHYNTDFDSVWVHWEIYSPGNGTVRAKVWDVNGTEPASYQLSRNLGQRATQFRIWSGTSDQGRVVYLDDVYISGSEAQNGSGGGVLADSESLSLDVRYYMQPNSTYPLSVYHYPDNFTRNEVTNQSTISIENVTFNGSQVITYNASGQTVSTNSNLSVAEELNITATYDTGNGTVNDTQNVVVAAPTVENLAILPNGLIRTQAVLTDGTLQALLVAALLSVPAARFTNAFAGLAVAEVVVVIGWLAGYTTLGIAMLSVFMAMFVGLNLAANIDYAISRGT